MIQTDNDNFEFTINEYKFVMRKGKLDIQLADDGSIYRMVDDHEEWAYLLARALAVKLLGSGGDYTCPIRSHYVSFYFCDNCDNLHISLRDSDNKVYSECILSDAMLLQAAVRIIERRKEYDHDYTEDSPPTQLP